MSTASTGRPSPVSKSAFSVPSEASDSRTSRSDENGTSSASRSRSSRTGSRRPRACGSQGPGCSRSRFARAASGRFAGCARRWAIGSWSSNAWPSGRSDCAAWLPARAAGSRRSRSSGCDGRRRRPTAAGRLGGPGSGRGFVTLVNHGSTFVPHPPSRVALLCDPRRDARARARGEGAERAERRRHGQLHLPLHGGPERGVPRGGGPPNGAVIGPAVVRAGDRRARRASAGDQAARALLRGPAVAGAPRLPARGGVPAKGPRGGAVTPGIEFNRRILDIPVYPAASTYAFEGELVKLASNETPWPPHPQVLEAVEAQLRNLNRYPDPEKALLRRRIAERTGVATGRVAGGG